MTDQSIAIVGLALRMPGARTLEEFWDVNCAGTSQVRRFTREELLAAGTPEEMLARPDFTSATAILDDIAAFDAGYFGVSPREAERTEPQQRIFLEVAHHALEDAGYAGPADRSGLRVGVYAGSGYHLYPLNSYLRENIGAEPGDVDHVTGLQLTFGNKPDFIATKVSFRLGLTGPAATVLSGCSTGLVAVRMGTQALLSGDADLALIGASAIHIPQVQGYEYVRGSVLSRTGVCRPFDADADGLVCGDGVAAVVLKRLDRALADGDRVHAVILGVGVNNDGDRKQTYAAPSGAGQFDAVRRALDLAGVDARDVGYVETHGTGTRKGDPIEFDALTGAYRVDTADTGFCALGSSKAVVGHMDGASGMTGLLRAIGAVKFGRIPPMVNYRRPNPAIDLDASPFYIPTSPVDWPGEGRRIAGVTALGIGGTNTHAIVAQAPDPAPRPAASARGPLPVSAEHPDALRELASAYASVLRETPQDALADVLATARDGRRHGRHRLVAHGATPSALADALNAFTTGTPGPHSSGVAGNVRPVFAYTGQGSGHRGMARALYEEFGVFRDLVDEALAHAEPRLTTVLLDVDGPEGPLPTDLAQPGLFVVQAAMTGLWRSLGVRPELVTGHSVGELPALYAAGALSLAEGVRMATGRGLLMQQETAPGGMLAVRATPTEGEALAAGCPGVVLAVVNGPESIVLAGADEAVDRAAAAAAAKGLSHQRLAVTRAFHSPLLDPILDAIGELASTVDWRPVEVPFVSGLDGEVRPAGWTPDPGYLRDQARRPVRFDLVADTVAATESALMLELGPRPTLTALMRAAHPGVPAVATVTRDDADSFHRALGELYVAGLTPVWGALPSIGEPRRAALPLYPFRRDRHWTEATKPSVRPPGDTAMTALPALDPDVLETVTDSAARQLGCLPADIDPDTAFAAYGADSMLLVTMISELDNRYGVRVTMRELFEDADTANKLATLITRRRGDSGAAPARTREVPGTAPVSASHGGASASPSAARPTAVLPAVPVQEAAPANVGPTVPQAVTPPAPVAATAPVAPQPGAATSQPAAPVPGSAVAQAFPAPTYLAPAPNDAYAALAFAAHETARAAHASAEAASAAARAVEQVALRLPMPGQAPVPPVQQVDPGSAQAEARPEPAVGTEAVAVAPKVTSPEPQEKSEPAPEPPTPASAAPPATVAVREPSPAAAVFGKRPARSTAPDFGLYFFGDYPGASAGEVTSADSYAVLREAARFADTNGFSSLWLPERHFDSFGGLFPNPAVLAAALAAETSRIRINAGSVVLPLHDTIRVAEEWSMVDGLSNGRIGIGVASGWHPGDFVFFPERFGERAKVMYEQLGELRRFWSGEAASRTGGAGSTVDVRLYPRPVQAAPPMYTAIVGRRESYAEAARHDLNVVTNLMTQTPEQLADNIAHYRAVRAEHGLDPDGGRVTVLLHAYLAEDMAAAREEAYEPFKGYMRSSLKLFGQMAASLGLGSDVDTLPAEDLEYLFRRAYDRYCGSRALIGSPRSAQLIVDAVAAAGVDEIAALVDFGMPAEALRRGLPHLAALRDSCTADETAPAVPAPVRVAEPAPLSPGQERIWLAEQIQPEECAYNEPRAIRLTGDLDVERLRTSLDALVARHPMLRTVFAEREGRPVGVARTESGAALTVEDHSGLDEERVVEEAMAAESLRRFDLEHGPLFITRLLRFAERRHVLVFSFHHIIVDAVSATVLTRDLSALYRGEELPPLGEATAAPDPAKLDEDLRYWSEQLAGDLPALSMPTDRPRPAMLSAAGAADSTRLGAELTGRVAALAAGRSATVFMTLLAGIAVTLRRFTGQDEIVIGVPIARRREGTEDQVGFLVNTLALRLDLSGDPDFAAVLAQVRTRTLDAYDHADAPFESVLRGLRVDRETSRNPVFQVMAEYKGAEVFRLDLPGVTAEPLEVWRSRAMVDLAWHFTNSPEGLGCHLEYSADLFDATTAARVGHYLRDTLDTAAQDPAKRLSAFTALSEEDEALTGMWSRGPERPRAFEPVHRRIAGHAKDTPDAVAIADGGTSVSFAELDDAADRLAHLLHAEGIRPGDVVAVRLPRGAGAVTAQLAVLKTGAAYLPLDPALGEARLAHILADSRAALTVTDTALASRLPKGTRYLCPDSTALTAAPSGPLDVETGPDDACYVIYTSGSTGSPKGVVVTHRGLANLCDWHRERFTVTAADRGAAVCGLSFDASVFESWPMLAAGASLAVASEEVRLSTKDLADWYRDSGATISLLPTALGEELLGLPAEAQPPLRTLVIGGDVLRRRPAPGLPFELVNAYGPTEATVLVSTHTVDPDESGPVPIGAPIDNTRLHVLDAGGTQVPVGVTGELFIEGEALAAGYLHAPELTAERFPVVDGVRLYRTGDLARWTDAGVLEFRGRADDQVKVRGFRVEPGEVTAFLRALPDLADAAVLALRDGHGDAYLAAYLVPARTGEDVTAKASRAARDALPGYLVPAQWTVVDRLPYDANGKLDRAALASAPPAVAETAVETGETETLAALWEHALGIAVTDREASFFSLGGHSISALRLLNAVRAEFGVDYPAADFYRRPTMAAMLARLAETQAPVAATDTDETTASFPLVVTSEAPGTGDTGPLSTQQANFARHADEGNTFNVSFQLTMSGDVDPGLVQASLDALIVRHQSLRTSFTEVDGEWTQTVLPAYRAEMEHLDLRGLPAGERDERVEEATRSALMTAVDLAGGRPWRQVLFRLGGDEWRLLLVATHIVTDGWAMSLLLQEFAELYTSLAESRPPRLEPAGQSLDYARRQAGAHDEAETARRLDYWVERLRSTPMTIPLPYDRSPDEHPVKEGRLIRRELPPELASTVREAARLEGTTPFAVLGTALGVYLAGLTGQRRLLLNAVHASRETKADETVVASLAGAGFLELDIDPDRPFTELVAEHYASYLDGLAHHLSFWPVFDALREVRPSEEVPAPPLSASFFYQSSVETAIEIPGLRVVAEEVPLVRHNKSATFFCVPSADRTELGLGFGTDMLSPELAAVWLDEYIATVERLCADPTAPVGKV